MGLRLAGPYRSLNIRSALGILVAQMDRLSRTCVDLFAGAGGLSCGLAQAGFRPIFANELEPVFAGTYKHNHPEVDVLAGDIHQVSPREIRDRIEVEKGEVDLVAGGPPCQGFSINAPIRALEDQRNHLFRNFLGVVEELAPKAVLIENVPGIMSFDGGSVVESIYESLEGLGYSVGHKILFAAHYGVPQMRWRTFFLAIAGPGVEIQFPSPTHFAKGVANFAGGKEHTFRLMDLEAASLSPHVNVWDALSDLPKKCSPRGQEKVRHKGKANGEYQISLRNGTDLVTNHHSSKLSPINLERLQHIEPGGSWRDIPFELLPKGLQRARRSDHTKRYGRLDKKGLCSTILTKCDPHWGSFFHPVADRVISVREAARIQSFPDHFEFLGSMTEQYRQVGNAVPPLMARAVGESLLNVLEESECQESVVT